jgi:CDP-diacylglycerol--serine O-phosphatidyltransferase
MIDRRKWVYLLPNAFTVSSIFCGLYAMTLVAGEASPDRIYQAALAIFFGMLFDGCDGRVARLTKTQSEFGMQLDSLADVITFGVAPALLLWKWALSPLGFLGLLLAFAFAAAGALRLARFNVLEMRGNKGCSRFFVGLPIPLAAGVVVSLVIAHHRAAAAAEVPAFPVALLTALLAFLMVSTVRYRTFKDVRFSRKSAAVLGLLLASGVAITLQFRASFTLVTFAILYVSMGLAEEVVFFRRRRAERLAARAALVDGSTAVVGADDEDDLEDEEP